VGVRKPTRVLWVMVPLGPTLALLVWIAGVRSPAAAPADEPVVVIEPRVVALAEPTPAVEGEATVAAAVPVVPVPDPRHQPATAAARKVLALQASIRASMTYTAYRHRTSVRRDAGVYVWDCSAMVAWFLRKVAPKARAALAKGRPVARDFYRQIARAPTRRPRDGWQRLAHIEDVRPGDMFAWIRPPGFPSRNTGHTGFALEPARPVPELPGAYTLRIVDATSLPHDHDTRDPAGEGGIGEGTILFLVNEDGRGVAYGWFGRRSRGVIATDIVFGRISR
jgi:hypothetical protein